MINKLHCDHGSAQGSMWWEHSGEKLFSRTDKNGYWVSTESTASGCPFCNDNWEWVEDTQAYQEAIQ